MSQTYVRLQQQASETANQLAKELTEMKKEDVGLTELVRMNNLLEESLLNVRRLKK